MASIRVICVLAAFLALMGVLVSRLPHLSLAAQLATGQIDGSSVSITDAVWDTVHERAVALRCRGVSLEAPCRAVARAVHPEGSDGLVIELDGLTCRVFAPRCMPDGDADEWVLPGGPARSGEEELRRRLAICATDGHDLSLGMSDGEVRAMQERLIAKPIVTLHAECIEVIRGRDVCGLLHCWTIEGRPRLRFEYFSRDNRTRGIAFFCLESASPQALRTARSMAASFRLEESELQPGVAASDEACGDLPARKAV